MIEYVAIEAQAFTVRNPGSFFNIYSPPRSETSFKPMRDRLDEELRFMSKMVCARAPVYLARPGR